MKQLTIILSIVTMLSLIASCGGNKTSEDTSEQAIGVIEKDTTIKGAMRYVELTDPLDEEDVARGAQIYEARCAACHELSDDLLVAPGWEGITNRRSPEWIMNMILNVNIMLEVDSTAHELLEETEVVMPDQYLAVDDARSVLEFMRSNDLERLGTKDLGRTETD